MSAAVFDATPCSLGEGPLWHPEENCLYWFDINNMRLYRRAGVDLDELRRQTPGAIVAVDERKKRWKDVWSAGHGVTLIDEVKPMAAIVEEVVAEYHATLDRLLATREG